MEKIYNHKSLILYLIFLFPFFLISGPLLPDLIISGFALLVLFYLVKKQLIFRDNIFYFLLIFYIYININSTFFSDTKVVSLKSTLPYIRFILFSVFLGIAIYKVKELKKIIFYSFLLAYLILLIDSCFQLVFGFNFLGYPYTQRMSSLFGDESIMGSFVVRTLPVVLAISYTNRFISNSIFLQLSILTISGILVYFSSERTSTVYYFAILLSYLVFNIKNIKFFFLIIVFFLLLFSSLFFIKKDSADRIITHTISQFNNYGSNQAYGHKIFFSYRHTLHYSTAIDLFNDRKLLGHGVKSFRYLCSKEKYSQLNKIKEDNLIYAPIDGFFHVVKIKVEKKNNKLYVVVHPKNSSFPSIFPNLNSFKAKISPDLFFKLLHGNIFYNDLKNGDYVKKGSPLISFYEYLNGCNTHPHNIHLQFLAELGLVGYSFLLFSFLFISYKMLSIFITYFKNKELKRYNFEFFFILLGLFLSLFPFFPSGNFFNNWLSAIFFINVSYLISIMKSKIYK